MREGANEPGEVSGHRVGRTVERDDAESAQVEGGSASARVDALRHQNGGDAERGERLDVALALGRIATEDHRRHVAGRNGLEDIRRVDLPSLKARPVERSDEGG